MATKKRLEPNKYVEEDENNCVSPEKKLISGAGVMAKVRNNSNMKCNLLELDDVCALLKIGRSTLYGLVNAKSIKAVKLLGRTLFREEDVNEYVASLPNYEGGSNGF